jgi:hypothetical protein
VTTTDKATRDLAKKILNEAGAVSIKSDKGATAHL